MKAEEIISLLLEDDKIKSSRLFGDKIYKDEPILQPASKLLKEQTPEAIKQMKQMAFTSEAVWRTEEWLFYKQGRFMEKYDDIYECDDVRSLPRPAYNLLNTDELRGFFTWRGKLRRCEEVAFIDTYILLYSYELINLIGADSPEEAFDRLYELRDRFCNKIIASALTNMLADMAAYYRLPDELRLKLPLNEFDSALIELIHCDSSEDVQLFDALTKLSNYKLDNSSAYKKRPQEFSSAVCETIKALSAYYGAGNFITRYFGLMLSHWYTPFRSAVFFNNGKADSFEYKINEIRIYICEQGFWQLKSFFPGKSKKLGAILRTADCLIRPRLEIGASIKKGNIEPEEEQIITKALDGYFERKRLEALPKINIDMSKLDQIRRTAEITRDKLIVEEEETETPLPVCIIEPVVDTAANENNEDELPLTNTEAAFIHALLYDGDIRSAAEGTMPSLLADSINEKLFDMFGDTVIGFDGDTPMIIEDYEEELKGKIHR